VEKEDLEGFSHSWWASFGWSQYFFCLTTTWKPWLPGLYQKGTSIKTAPYF